MSYFSCYFAERVREIIMYGNEDLKAVSIPAFKGDVALPSRSISHSLFARRVSAIVGKILGCPTLAFEIVSMSNALLAAILGMTLLLRFFYTYSHYREENLENYENFCTKKIYFYLNSF